MSKQTASNLRATVQFREVETKSGKKAFEAWCAVWGGEGFKETNVVICAPTLKKLEEAWPKITGGIQLHASGAQHVWLVKAE